MLIVAVGLLLAFVPARLAFVWFGLAGPVVEIEGRSVRGALARSWRLVRGHFWLVFRVLVPIEVVGDARLRAGSPVSSTACSGTRWLPAGWPSRSPTSS